ncbi:restriction endonuclease subunit S [Escherichia coli]|uniref:Restriction endonuclease subunit S n=2 Tax=Enterobacteriaceae TaxID=543 RepID=A0A1S9JDU4_SHIBO|nr:MULTISPECIES: hypothetical protein [Enterobacteriaceae]EFC8048332.1 restriction endonuclease subunit S [Escherichia coli O157]EHS0494375.1 restriction endonuclease subunit S [Escherichia coli O26]AVL09235.1 hypothetical protein C6C13_11825 [Escherichia coli]EEC9201840.1 restriction endonuclease subunit S [Escherichia coli]EED0312448.1 restriction endonuclease subunit S [Escherichia coli]
MSRNFQVKAVPSSWLENNGRRLDCGPYLSGAMEAKEKLRELKVKKEPLESLMQGIFHAGRESRLWVDTKEYGVEFLSSSEIQLADLSFLPLISKKQVAANPNFTIRQNWTLITRSGTIGRMAYAGPNLDGLACSEHVMRVAPDQEKVLPGYIFAYLSSKFGVPLIVSGTYGSIIQSIEPNHIAELPVPRLGDVEKVAHDLIQLSANLRVEARAQLKNASLNYLSYAGISDITAEYWRSNARQIGFTSSVNMTSLRAINYLPINQQIESFVREKCVSWKPLIDLVETGTLRSGPRFKRIDSDPEFGVELIGQGECFNLRPSGRWIAKKYLPNDRLLFPPDGAVMIAAQGCAGEHDLFGRAQFITGKRLNYAYSQHFLRVIADENEIPRGALFAYLNSQIAYRIRKGYQIGSMQQDFHPDMIKQMPVPIIERAEAEKIDAAVRSAYKKFDDAIDAEDEAVALVERTIEEGGR